MTLERHLRRALDRDELHVVYQPVVDIADSSIVGMEALLRWNCADLGPVSPADFIPIAERTGLILPIGRFVLARAVEQLAAWQAAGHDVRMSVNLSASQLTDEQLPDLLVELLETARAPAERLCSSSPSRALMRDTTDQPLQMLERLRTTGAGSSSTTSARATRRSPASAASPRGGQDRPLVHRRDGGRRRRPRRRHRRHADGRPAAAARSSPRASRPRASATCCGARLPARPGLPLRPARAGGRGDRDARTRRRPRPPSRVPDRPTRSNSAVNAVPVLGITTRPSRTATALAVDRRPSPGAAPWTTRWNASRANSRVAVAVDLGAQRDRVAGAGHLERRPVRARRRGRRTSCRRPPAGTTGASPSARGTKTCSSTVVGW